MANQDMADGVATNVKPRQILPIVQGTVTVVSAIILAIKDMGAVLA